MIHKHAPSHFSISLFLPEQQINSALFEGKPYGLENAIRGFNGKWTVISAEGDRKSIDLKWKSVRMS